jgi:uncharacterized protein (TIGR02246 family)
VSSADDRLAILELHGRYSFAADTRDPEAYAAVFTDDGAFVGRVGQPDETRIEGREKLLAFARRSAAQPDRHGRHHQSSPVFVELEADRAVTRTYLMWTGSADGEPPMIGLTSIYEDHLVKTAGGWRIAARLAIPDVKGVLRERR